MQRPGKVQALKTRTLLWTRIESDPTDHRNYLERRGYLDGPDEEENGRIPDGRRIQW